MNQVVLTGRLTKDVEVKYTQNDKAIASFTIATNRLVVRDGEETADFINCIAWGKTAENLAKYQKKGSLIGIIGRLQIKSYEDSKGNRKQISEVLVNEIEYLGTKKDESKETAETNPFEDFGKNLKSEGNGIEINDNDLPF